MANTFGYDSEETLTSVRQNPGLTGFIYTDEEGVETTLTFPGIAHTAITGIDLRPTGVVNQYTVVVTWTDSDGVAQTTTDPTPIIISGGGAPLATTIPIADNETDTAIRTGLAGISLFAARADHNHPIRRQVAVPNPQPVHLLSNGSTVTSEAFLTLRSDEERLVFSYRVNHLLQAGNGWNSMLVPSLAGFQRPIIIPMGTYHYQGQWQNGTAETPVPFMGQSATHYLDSLRVYFGSPNRSSQIRTWNAFYLEYIRS